MKPKSHPLPPKKKKIARRKNPKARRAALFRSALKPAQSKLSEKRFHLMKASDMSLLDLKPNQIPAQKRSRSNQMMEQFGSSDSLHIGARTASEKSPG